jgi:hypothetical protein
MRLIRALMVLAVAIVLLWLGWNGFPVISRIASDRAAAEALKARVLKGERVVPARKSKDLRGDEGADYWCFSNDACFYPMARFRVLYPAYNDLEDDVLINEVRDKLLPHG